MFYPRRLLGFRFELRVTQVINFKFNLKLFLRERDEWIFHEIIGHLIGFRFVLQYLHAHQRTAEKSPSTSVLFIKQAIKPYVYVSHVATFFLFSFSFAEVINYEKHKTIMGSGERETTWIFTIPNESIKFIEWLKE